MDKEIFFSIEENAEGGFMAEAPEYTIQVEADNLDDLVREIHYTLLSDFDETDRPTFINLEFPNEPANT